MRLTRYTSPARWAINMIAFNWFLVVPILIGSVYFQNILLDDMNKSFSKLERNIKYNTTREIIATTDGRVAVADRVKLENNNGKLVLPDNIRDMVKNSGNNIDLTIQTIKDYLYK